MREVAIIGAGELGGAVAHQLARRDLVRAIRLIDENGSIAAGKALDLSQAAPIEGFATEVSGSTDVATGAGASIVVLAERAVGGEWRGDDGVQLLRRIAASAPTAVIVCSGSQQRELIERGVRELRIARDRLIGTAPEALTAAARALVAVAANVSPRDVSLTIVGVPPDHTVVAWDEATIGGFALTRQIDEPTRRRIARHVVAVWPPGPHALAAASIKAIEAIAGRGRRIVSCFVGPDTAMGLRTRAAALPVRLSRSGIADVIVPSLSVGERIALDNAVQM